MTRRRDVGSFAAGARREIERPFQGHSIFAHSRDVALYHYATALDIEVIRALYLTPGEAAASNMAHWRCVESSTLAIPAIFQRCPATNNSSPRFDAKILEEAVDFFEFCYRYEQVDFSLRLADKGQFQL